MKAWLRQKLSRKLGEGLNKNLAFSRLGILAVIVKIRASSSLRVKSLRPPRFFAFSA